MDDGLHRVRATLNVRVVNEVDLAYRTTMAQPGMKMLLVLLQLLLPWCSAIALPRLLYALLVELHRLLLLVVLFLMVYACLCVCAGLGRNSRTMWRLVSLRLSQASWRSCWSRACRSSAATQETRAGAPYGLYAVAFVCIVAVLAIFILMVRVWLLAGSSSAARCRRSGGWLRAFPRDDLPVWCSA